MHTDNEQPTRREFIKASGAVAVAGAVAAPFILPSSAWAARRADDIKIGLVGCGGRGSGAASQALSADPGVVLTAVGDVDPTHMQSAVSALKGDATFGSRVRVEPNRMFDGLDCYQKVIASGVDVVLLASPPGFRPREIRAAIEAGKHVFAEKPFGTDAPNARSVIEAAKQAKTKKLALMSGFCWRHDYPRRELYKRILDGAIGPIRHVHATYLTGPVKPMPPASSRPAGMGDVEWQIRNWYNFVWLSGDGLVEQACHSVDKILWAMKDVPPARCTATGGRVNPNNEGNIYDHIDVFYEWPDGTRATMAQRQIPCPHNENNDYIAGGLGYAQIKGAPSILGPTPWQYEGPGGNMYQIEHNELFASIRKGDPYNDGERAAHSTLAGIMGRTAAYTGEQVTWEQIMASNDALFPENLTWDMKLPIPPMAVPGRRQG